MGLHFHFFSSPFYQLKEDNSVHGSDEENDDPPEVDSDEDFSDDGCKQNQEEVKSSILINVVLFIL